MYNGCTTGQVLDYMSGSVPSPLIRVGPTLDNLYSPDSLPTFLRINVDDPQDLAHLGLQLHVTPQNRRHVHILNARLVDLTESGDPDAV